MEEETIQETRRRTHQANAGIYSLIDNFGDRLAKQNGWQCLVGGEAVRYYLMQKHHWTPAYVMAMSYEELRFAISQEKGFAPAA